MRNNARDIFRNLFGKRKTVEPSVTTVPTVAKENKFQHRKAPPSKWIIQHNQFQAQQANKIAKRRKANKVASKQRKLNRAA